MTDQKFSRITIIGLGLIGGSLAMALRHACSSLTAYDEDSQSLARGLELGVIDTAADTLEAAIADADLVVVAVPVLAMGPILDTLQPLFGSSTVITDVGSVKQPLIDMVMSRTNVFPPNIVPGHPIAGSERHGVLAARADLFAGHQVILTPPGEGGEAVRVVEHMWQTAGATVVRMTPAHHDEVLAQTSHLPHLLAFSLIDTLSARGDSPEIFDYAAGGLRDFSRIAASDPAMWRDIFMTNRQPLLDSLERFTTDLARVRALIEEGNASGVFEFLARSKAARDHFSEVLAARLSERSRKSNGDLL